MTNLQLLMAIALFICAWAYWKHCFSRHGRAELIAFAALCAFWLGLALRFGARTYPGLHFPYDPLLNKLLNGSAVFATVGYFAVITGFVAYVTVALTQGRGSVRRGLKMIALISVTTAVLVAIYGFYWAALLGRSA